MFSWFNNILKNIKNWFTKKTLSVITPKDVQVTSAPLAANYISAKLRAFPYDENSKIASVVMLPIVDANGKIIGYLPPSVIDNGDGTATLKIRM
jgi:YbbR domain-containing protein